MGLVPYCSVSMGHTVIEDVEDRIGDRVVRRQIIRTDDP